MKNWLTFFHEKYKKIPENNIDYQKINIYFKEELTKTIKIIETISYVNTKNNTIEINISNLKNLSSKKNR